MKYIKFKKLLLFIFIYTILTIILSLSNINLYSNIINPCFWVLIILHLIIYMQNSYIRLPKNKKNLIIMTIITIINIILYFYLGFIFGFIKNPYSHEIKNIIKNIITQIIPIIGIEFTRNILLVKNKNNKLIVIFITVLFILLEINYHTIITNLNEKKFLFQYLSSNIFPLIAYNILYSYLTQKNSCLIILINAILNRLTIILLPILPALNWFITGSIGLISPVIIYILYKFFLPNKRRKLHQKKNCFRNSIAYVLTLIFAIILICFTLGLFKYEPIAILSNSMFPTFSQGDIVVFKKIDRKELQFLPEKTIIIYNIEDKLIVHRIIEVNKSNKGTSYITKGDSNNAPDLEAVTTEQIKGTYLFRIKYIGFLSIWLNDYLSNKESFIEIK